MINLTSLEIIFADNLIEDNGLLEIIKIIDNLKKLEWVVINLYDNNIKYEKIGDIEIGDELK